MKQDLWHSNGRAPVASRAAWLAVAATCLALAAALPGPARAQGVEPGLDAAGYAANAVRGSFDPDRILVRLAPGLVDAMETRRAPGETTAARLGRAARLADLDAALRLDSFAPAFRQPPPSRAAGATARRVRERRREVFLVGVRGDRDVVEVLEEVRAHPDVEQAQLNYIYTPDLVPADPLYGAQYAHALTDAELGWNLETGEREVSIAIIGTGVELDHPDLAANLWTNPGEIPGNLLDDDLNGFVDDVHGWDFASGDNDPNPSGDSHETQVAGVAGAVANNAEGIAGVCWDCRLMPLRIAYTSVDVAEAIDYAVDNDASVINMSFGNYDPPKYGIDSVVEDAVIDAFANGVVLVATAGNNSTDTMRFPAALDEVIAVAATDAADRRAGFSNYGSWVTVAAPGVLIRSTNGPSGYSAVNGTSFAAPYVAGVAALLFSADGSLSPTSVWRRIEYSVDPIDPDHYIGTGRVNVAKALSLTADPDHFAVIKAPLANAALSGVTSFEGTALGDGYVLEYRALGDPTWTPIASGPQTVDDELGTLDADTLATGSYEVRLTASLSGALLEDVIPVFVNDIKAGWPQTVGTAIVSSASYADVDGDGELEVFVAANGGKVAGFEPDGTSLPGWPVSLGGFPFGSPAIGDVDGDGELDVLQGSYVTGFVYAYDRFGVGLPGWPRAVNQKVRGAVALADLDGDGTLDAIAAGSRVCATGSCGDLGRVAAFRGDGSSLPGWPVAVEYNLQTTPAVGDIDGDGDPEVIVQAWKNLYAFHHDGTSVAGWPLPYETGHSSPLLVDHDGDGAMEALVFDLGLARLLAGDGTLVRSFPLPGGVYYSYAAIGEIDGGGAPEFCVGANNGAVHLRSLDGGSFSGWPVLAGADVAACAFADADGDGAQEVLAGSLDGLVYAWELDGSPVSEGWPLSAGSSVHAMPVLTDLEGDGRGDLIIGGEAGELVVFELDASSALADPEWPMLQGSATHDGRYLPEPAGAAALAAGIALLGALARRRTRPAPSRRPAR